MTDSSSAVVAGANVRLVNRLTNAELTAATDESGLYSFPRLAPGIYVLKIEKTGFQRAAIENIEITVNEAATADVNLAIGEISATVTIEGGANIVQTQTAEISQLVSGRRTRELPLNGENFQQIVNLAPGVGGIIAGSGGITNPSISGARPVANSYTIDGVAANDERTTSGLSIAGGAAGLSGGIAPNLVSTEALQEFRIVTSNFRRAAGSLNVEPKTNSIVRKEN